MGIMMGWVVGKGVMVVAVVVLRVIFYFGSPWLPVSKKFLTGAVYDS